MSENVVVTTDGIRKLLRRYDSKQAVAEYIWNGFDAGAKTVSLEYEVSFGEVGAVTRLAVKDDGKGIPYSELHRKFEPFFQSEKALSVSHPRNQSLCHGKNGAGRLTFFRFAGAARWRTTVVDNDRTISFDIEIKANQLNSFDPVTPVNTPDEPTGTRVSFSDVHALNSEIMKEDVIPFLSVEFGWFLELNAERGLQILINGDPLDYSSIVEDRDDVTFTHKQSDTTFDVRFVRWSQKLHEEYSKNYFINSLDMECWKENTTLNNKGDNFFHSAFVKSSYFDQFQWDNPHTTNGAQDELFATRRSAAFRFLSNELSAYLQDKRTPFIKQYTEQLMREYEKDDVFPEFDSSAMAQYQKETLRDTVKELYLIQPQIFTSLNVSQKKAFIELLNAMLELGADDKLLEIISKLVDMTEEQRHEFAEILEYVNIAAITKTIGLVKDRIKTVEELKKLVFDPALEANERDHLQKLIEKHYWLFGEQYNLVTAEEPDFEEALRRYKSLLGGDGVKRAIDHEDKNKEMDIFVCRRDIRNDLIDNIVVELKHPDIKLGRKELNQVETYLGVILDQPEFNAANMTWTFILVGKTFDTSETIEDAMENAANHGERYLVKKSVKKRYKIYVMKWSEVFAEFECRHNFLLKKLNLDKEKLLKEVKAQKSAAKIVADAKENSAAEDASWNAPRESIGENDIVEEPIAALEAQGVG